VLFQQSMSLPSTSPRAPPPEVVATVVVGGVGSTMTTSTCTMCSVNNNQMQEPCTISFVDNNHHESSHKSPCKHHHHLSVSGHHSSSAVSGLNFHFGSPFSLFQATTRTTLPAFSTFFSFQSRQLHKLVSRFGIIGRRHGLGFCFGVVVYVALQYNLLQV